MPSNEGESTFPTCLIDRFCQDSFFAAALLFQKDDAIVVECFSRVGGDG